MTRSAVHGTTLRVSTRGVTTLREAHGFFVMRSSSTALLMIVLTSFITSRRDDGAPLRPFAHDRIVLGLIAESGMPPSTGSTWSRRRSSRCDRVVGAPVCVASQSRAYFPNVIRPASGSMYVPRSTSASVVVRNVSASLSRRNVFLRRVPSGSRYVTS